MECPPVEFAAGGSASGEAPGQCRRPRLQYFLKASESLQRRGHPVAAVLACAFSAVAPGCSLGGQNLLALSGTWFIKRRNALEVNEFPRLLHSCETLSTAFSSGPPNVKAA